MGSSSKTHSRREFIKSAALAGLAVGAGPSFGRSRDGVGLDEATRDDTSSQHPGLPPLPNYVRCNNSRPMHGKVRMIALPISYKDTGCKYTHAKIVSGCKGITNTFKSWSRGKVQLCHRDGTGDYAEPHPPIKVPSTYAEGKRPAYEYIREHVKIPDNCIKWYITGKKNPSSGGLGLNTPGPGGMTVVHELGHVFRLGHGESLNYDRKTHLFADFNGYGDKTTSMGNQGGGGFNLPQYHRLGWIDEDEVALFRKEDSGKVYRIRDIHHHVKDGNLAGVCYYLPTSGQLMWLALNRRGVHGNDFLGKDLALSKYATSWNMTSGMQPTVAFDIKCGEHTDDFGLTYKLVGMDSGKQPNWVDIQIAYSETDFKRNKPLVIKQTRKTIRPVATGKGGIVEVTMEVTNPNDFKTTTPVVTQIKKLEVPGARRVTQEWGTAAWKPNKKRGGGMHPCIPGECTGKHVYRVESQPGPLAPKDAVLKATYQFAFLNPFEFDVTF